MFHTHNIVWTIDTLKGKLQSLVCVHGYVHMCLCSSAQQPNFGKQISSYEKLVVSVGQKPGAMGLMAMELDHLIIT